MAFTNFGEAFAKNTLRKFYATAIVPVITNTNYEGEVKKIGDRVNVLQFLDDVPLGDYSVGTDMTTTFMVDTESTLQINNQKYWNFSIDSVDKAFTYVNDPESTLIENAANVLSKTIDKRFLDYYIEDVRAGNRVPKKERDGTWTYAVGDTGTYVTITTSATVATATLTGMRNGDGGAGGDSAEAGAFPVDIVGKGFRICSDLCNSPWYRVTSRTSSTVLTFNNWDGSVTGGGQIVRGIMGIESDDVQLDGGGPGHGCQIEGMKSTQATSSNVYALLCHLKTALDDDGVPSENRHVVVPPWFQNLLIQASVFQPDIAMYHAETVVNGKVGRGAGLDIHMVSDDRFSTDTDPFATASATLWTAHTGYKILACHTSFATFAHKWAESRVVEAENQFAKKYQGLNLYGFKVLNLRRKCGAYLYAYQ